MLFNVFVCVFFVLTALQTDDNKKTTKIEQTFKLVMVLTVFD